MSDFSLYSMVIIFFAFALLPIMFIKTMKIRAMYLGLISSLSINLYFYLGLTVTGGMERFHEWHVFTTVYLPILLGFFAVLMTVMAKSILRGSVPLNEWGVDQAKKLLAQERNIFRRLFACVLITLDFPMYVFAGWMLSGYLIFRYIFNGH